MPTIGVLDALLLAGPVSLAALGMIRGSAVELASCVSTATGLIIAWVIAFQTPVQTLGTPMAVAVGLVCGIVAWRLARHLCQRLAHGQRPSGWTRCLDGVAGAAMGASRGVALVAAVCFAYAVVLVPVGLHDPAEAIAYPVYLQVASAASGVAVAAPVKTVEPTALPTAVANAALPGLIPAIPPPTVPARPALMPAILNAIAPSAAAAPVLPRTVDVPVRQFPASLVETHHNLLHPFGLAPRRPRH